MGKYRLQTLLEIRERAEEDAKQEFALAMKKLRDEEEFREKMEEELEDMIADRKKRREDYSLKLASGEMRVTDQSGANRFIERMKENEIGQKTRIDNQKEVVREAEKAVKRAQDALIEASQELKALEKHKEKWQAEVKRARALKEADMLDEIGQTIYQTRKE